MNDNDNDNDEKMAMIQCEMVSHAQELMENYGWTLEQLIDEIKSTCS